MRAMIAVFALAAGAAQAQESGWPEPVTTALFADADFTMLRPADEIATNWALLTEADRATVRADCEAPPEGGVPDAEAMRLACEALPPD